MTPPEPPILPALRTAIDTAAWPDRDEPAAVKGLLLLLEGGAAIINPDELLGTKETSELLGVDRTTVSRWSSAGYLPAPFRRLATGPVWLRSVVEAFASEHAASADAAGRRPIART